MVGQGVVDLCRATTSSSSSSSGTCDTVEQLGQGTAAKLQLLPARRQGRSSLLGGLIIKTDNYIKQEASCERVCLIFCRICCGLTDEPHTVQCRAVETCQLTKCCCCCHQVCQALLFHVLGSNGRQQAQQLSTAMHQHCHSLVVT